MLGLINLIDKSDTENNLRTLAAQVLQEYDMVPDQLSVIQSGSVKTVWKFAYQNREYCLKRLKQSLDKVLFSVNAQIYIKNSGGNVPGIVLNKNNEPIVKFDNQLFAVYEWLRGIDLDFSNPKHLSLAIEGLAKFHAASKGYSAIEGARVSSKLKKWPNQYESMKKKLIAWKEIAGTNSSPQHKSYLACVDAVIDLADQAIMLLDKSMYRELTIGTSHAPVLCHQDYGKGNALLTNEGVVVIDLDGVTFDLPSRDLRKIIGKISEYNYRWDKRTIDDILLWYSNGNKITDDEKKVLYIDLLFPHWFFGLVKNQYDKLKDIKASKIERIARLELSKGPIIRELLERL
ncbi:MAG: CotS family spore coat protein [Clostridiaceae bacterium]|nr:CotS family spore coat protein [Clostridiaceae bacterium]